MCLKLYVCESMHSATLLVTVDKTIFSVVNSTSKPRVFAGKRKAGIVFIKEAITALQNRRMCLINSVHTCRSGIFNRKIRHRPISGARRLRYPGLFYCFKKDFGVLIESCCGKSRDRKYAMWSLLLVPALRFIWFARFGIR